MPTNRNNDKFVDAVKPALGEQASKTTSERASDERLQAWRRIAAYKQTRAHILESLLSDLQKTTEVLRRAGRKSADDRGDDTSSAYMLRLSGGTQAATATNENSRRSFL